MAVTQRAVDATVDCTVRVARDADGTLADGAANQLARVEGVDDVDDVAVAGLEPRLNDLAVDVEASVRVAVAREDGGTPARAVERVLEEGFGVDVAEVRVEA